MRRKSHLKINEKIRNQTFKTQTLKQYVQYVKVHKKMQLLYHCVNCTCDCMYVSTYIFFLI